MYTSAPTEEVASSRKPQAERRTRPRHPLNYVFEAPQDILEMRVVLNQIGPWIWSCKTDSQGYCIQTLVREAKTAQRIQIHGDQLGNGPRFSLSLGAWGKTPEEISFREQIEQQFMTVMVPAIQARNVRAARRAT